MHHWIFHFVEENEEEYRIQAIDVPSVLQKHRFTKICLIIQLKANTTGCVPTTTAPALYRILQRAFFA